MSDCLKEAFIGPEKSGKTFAALHVSKKEKLIIRLNPTGEASMMEGAHVVTSKRQLLSAVKSRDRRKKTVICWNISSRLNGFEAFDFACRVAIATPERCAIFLNEGETLFPKTAKVTAHVNEVIRRGRQHCLVPIYWTAQRPKNMNYELRDNTTYFNFFRNTKDSYVDFVKSEAGKDAAAAVQALEKFSFIRASNTSEPWKIVKDVKKL